MLGLNPSESLGQIKHLSLEACIYLFYVPKLCEMDAKTIIGLFVSI